ncbi:MAG TPA: cytochrome c [Terriglobales bacterium]
MRKFVWGIMFAAAVGTLAVLACIYFGWMPTAADATPSPLERRIMMHGMDESMERLAPRVNSPVQPTDDNLIEGMKVYTMNCSVCHGTLDNKPSPLEKSFYPPAPQLLLDPPDDPEWHIFYAIRTGIRYTGMPAWNKALSEEDMWKVTMFLSRIEKLPPKVQDYWKNAYGASPPAGGSGMGDKD